MTKSSESCADKIPEQPGVPLQVDKPVVFVLGTGGVGKTSCALLLAHLLCQKGKRVLLLTVDPAKRLEDLIDKINADLPGLEVLRTNIPEQFRDFINSHAPDEETAVRILESRFFPHLTQRLQSLHEYVAGDRILKATREGSFDHIIVDTPPFAFAMHFLEAPQRLRQMASIGSTLFGTKASGRSIPRFLSPVIFKGLSYFLGRGFLSDLVDFVAAFGRLWPAIEETAAATENLYRSQSAFGLVCRPDLPSTEDLNRFLQHSPDWLRVSFLIVNRVLRLPAGFPADRPSPDDLKQALKSCCLDKSTTLEKISSAATTTTTYASIGLNVQQDQQVAVARIAALQPDLIRQHTYYLPQLPDGISSVEELNCLRRCFGHPNSE